MVKNLKISSRTLLGRMAQQSAKLRSAKVQTDSYKQAGAAAAASVKQPPPKGAQEIP